MKKRVRKGAFSLVEVVLSLALLSLLLSTLFFWYHNLSRQKEAYSTLKGPLMEERYTHQRLQEIIPKVEFPLFLSEDNSLVFIFDRGPCIISELSGKVLAKLYHDRATSSLCLGIWPKPSREAQPRSPMQTHVLLEGVEECAFEFYYPPDPFKKPVDPKEVGHLHPESGWQPQWRISYGTLPALLKISITRAGGPALTTHCCEYLFDLPIPIIYPGVT